MGLLFEGHIPFPMPFNRKMRRKVVDDASEFASKVERVASMHWHPASRLAHQVIFSVIHPSATPYKYLTTRAPCTRTIDYRPRRKTIDYRPRRTIELPSSSQKRPGFSLSLPLRSGEGCLGSESMAGIVVVFDFDKTIIDCDSDNWVMDGLGATELFERLVPTMPWNSLMDWMMAELHAQGRSIEDIADVLKMAPLDPHVITAIKSAYAAGCELRIVSDANIFFIETILQHHDLLGYFSEINTNPSYIDEEGKLRILPYHDFHKSSHNCINCPPNMCKGIILERIRVSTFAEGKKRFIYLGDGKGDYCPSLQLTEDDHVMPRKYFPLWELISNDPTLLKAEVHEWGNGEELERVLLHLINKSLSTDGNISSQLLSADCKFHSISMSTHEPLLQALPIPH